MPFNGGVDRVGLCFALCRASPDQYFVKSDILVMDNLWSDKVNDIRKAIEAACTALLYLLSYSHYYSPVENCCYRPKANLQRTKDLIRKALNIDLRRAVENISFTDVKGWFRHCLYSQIDTSTPLLRKVWVSVAERRITRPTAHGQKQKIGDTACTSI